MQFDIHKQKPTRRTLRRIINNFIANGSVKGIQNKRKPVVDDQNVEIAILGYFRAHLRLSIGQAVRESGLSSGTIHRILKKHSFHPYSISVVQHLKDKVYATPLTTKEDCKERVRHAFNTLNADSIRKTTHQAVIKRCEKCLHVEGQNFEHLLK